MKYDVCVVGGCGHVGLPLSIAMAIGGTRVAIFDIDEKACRSVQAGNMPFQERGGQAKLKEAIASGRLELGSGPEVISESDAIVLVVGTPIDGHLAPSFRGVLHVLDSYKPFFRPGQLLILRSTLFPGTSERVLRWTQENEISLQVAVCPERIAQGFALEEIASLPQIVAGFTEEAVSRASRLFEKIAPEIVQMEPLEAELAKLFTNSWRYIKFAAANQFFMIAQDHGVNFDRIYQGVTHNYPRARDLPSPGFTAGPCLFKDTMQLSAYANNQFFLGHAAMLVNEGLPQFLLSHMLDSYDLQHSTVGILGMAFKANIDDTRDSLAFKMRDLLEMAARRVVCSDPYLDGPGYLSTEEAVGEADILVIAAPHSEYAGLDTRGKPVVDVWNVLGSGRQL